MLDDSKVRILSNATNRPGLALSVGLLEGTQECSSMRRIYCKILSEDSSEYLPGQPVRACAFIPFLEFYLHLPLEVR